MEVFCNQLEQVKDEDYALEGRGESLVVIKGNHCWLGLCLSKKEVTYLKDQIRGALLLHSAYQSIYL